jgi:hypothetical protein
MATAGLAGVTVLSGLLLVGSSLAQTKAKPNGSTMGTMAQKGGMGMMGPMKMTGTVTMNNKPYDMRCSMTPIGKARSSRMMRGQMGMGSMMMDQPMKMSGTMTMMGQKYRCEMVMTPAGNEGTQQGK